MSDKRVLSLMPTEEDIEVLALTSPPISLFIEP